MGRTAILVAFVLAAAACGGAADPGSAGTVVSNAPAVEDAAASDGGGERPDGRPAPDFTLALGQGGDFTLSSEQKPVYMVFWAEW